MIGIVAWQGESATALSWLALLAVPSFAALALGRLVHGARPEWAAAVPPLFLIAWAAPGALVGETAAMTLTGLGCIGLGWLLASVAPARWLKWGIYAMAAVDTWFVAADLLQGPNAVLTAAAPSGLPSLQVVHFGGAVMGFGDLFVAATLGCLLALPADGPKSRSPTRLFGPSAVGRGRVGAWAGARVRLALPGRRYVAGDGAGRAGSGARRAG